jgi:ribosomal protein L31E
MAQEFKEKIITVNLVKAFAKPRTKRTRSAMHFLKSAITKETRKTNIKISNAINEAIWGRGRYNCPRSLVVKLISDKDTISAYLKDEKVEEKKADKKEDKTTKAPVAKEAPKEEKATKTTKKE